MRLQLFTTYRISCINKALQVLSTALFLKLEPSLQDMTKQPWDKMTEPLADHSPYVSTILAILGTDIPLISKGLEFHYAFFCDLFVGNFCPELVGSIFKCKKFSDAGVVTLRVDMKTLQSALLQLPKVNKEASETDGEPSKKKSRFSSSYTF